MIKPHDSVKSIKKLFIFKIFQLFLYKKVYDFAIQLEGLVCFFFSLHLLKLVLIVHTNNVLFCEILFLHLEVKQNTNRKYQIHQCMTSCLIGSVNHFKPSGVKWLHFKVFRAILV